MVPDGNTREPSTVQTSRQARESNSPWTSWERCRPRNIQQYSQASTNRPKEKTMRYLIVIGKEPGSQNYSAHSPDVPGCIAVGDTFEECKMSMREALEFHLEGMLKDGDP